MGKGWCNIGRTKNRRCIICFTSFLKKKRWGSTTGAWNEEITPKLVHIRSDSLPFLCTGDLSGSSLRAVSTGEERLKKAFHLPYFLLPCRDCRLTSWEHAYSETKNFVRQRMCEYSKAKEMMKNYQQLNLKGEKHCKSSSIISSLFPFLRTLVPIPNGQFPLTPIPVFLAEK